MPRPPKALPNALVPPLAGVAKGDEPAPKAGVDAAPNAGVEAAAPKAGVEAAAPNKLVEVEPKAGVELNDRVDPNAGVEAAPKAGVLAAPNAGIDAGVPPNRDVCGVLGAPKLNGAAACTTQYANQGYRSVV